MATAWKVAATAMVGWFVSPVITFFLPKILSRLGFDATKKLKELKTNIIPKLEETLREVDRARMLERGEVPSVCELDDMAATLRHARDDALDIIDFEDAEHKIVARCWERLCSAAATCTGIFYSRYLPRFGASLHDTIDKLMRRLFGTVATCKSSCARQLQWAGMVDYGNCGRLYGAVQSSVGIALQWPGKILKRCWHGLRGAVESIYAMWIARVTRMSGSAPLLQWARTMCSPEDVLPMTTGDVPSGRPLPVLPWPFQQENEAVSESGSSDGPEHLVATPTDSASSEEAVSESDSRQQALVPLATPSHGQAVPVTTSSCSSLEIFTNCCRSIFYWLLDTYEKARSHRDLSYAGVGITSNQGAFDCVLTAISRQNLKIRIEEIESTISSAKNSALLGAAKKTAPDVIANKNRSKITDSNPKVFGREALCKYIVCKLIDEDIDDVSSWSTSPCYSVIGIYGVAGSGKTTFARYTRDFIKRKYRRCFEIIMCIHVSETFSVKDIFNGMLKDIFKDQHSNNSNLKELKKKLKQALRGKRFFLILDDLWVKTKNDPQLEELISPLNCGLEGSKIMVTARTKVAAGALCADEPMQMPYLDEEHYFSMFMHYALGGTSAVDEEFKGVGRVIAEKLHRSPIAAVVVAGRLGANRDINFWKNTADLDMLNGAMDVLWWSYQQLNPDIRRCLEYCNIFPKRIALRKDKLVCLWIAQGFVKTSGDTKDKEAVAEGYIRDLVSCSFLQHEKNCCGDDYFSIHDLMYELLDTVSGSDYLKIENARRHRREVRKPVVPRDVRHLFVEKYDAELIAEMVRGLKNLRTIIIYIVGEDTPIEEKVIKSICKWLPKLRVLAIHFSEQHGPMNQPKKFSFPESVNQLKHLCYLAFRTSNSCEVILPSTLTELEHIQLLDFGGAKILEFTSAGLITLRHIICSCERFPNIGRLTSLQEMAEFRVRDEEGYELQQLGGLDELRGTLEVNGLNNVKSKDEAVTANLRVKKWLTKLTLQWASNDHSSELVQADQVLESLCPPVGLRKLKISGYEGLRYPDWMVDKKKGGPKDLQELEFWNCSQLGPAPQLVEAFPHLCVLELWYCSWDTLPGNIQYLASLKKLKIYSCENIRSLPTLPSSLEEFHVEGCAPEFMESFQIVGDPNQRKIAHIPTKRFGVRENED